MFISGVAEAFRDSRRREPFLEALEIEGTRLRPSEEQVLADVPQAGLRKPLPP